jgi:hypothetical protein
MAQKTREGAFRRLVVYFPLRRTLLSHNVCTLKKGVKGTATAVGTSNPRLIERRRC